MAKKVVLKRKLKIISVLLFLIIVVLVCFGIKLLLDVKFKNIYIIHEDKNSYLTDEYVIEKAGLDNYPSEIKNFSFMIEKNLENDIFIKNAIVNKELFGTINVSVTENKVLFYREDVKKYVLEDGQETEKLPYELSPVRVINYIPDTVYDKFLKKFAKIDENVRNKISQIKYDPSEYDDSRFMLYMIDGNYVYATLTKFDSLNYYNDIYPTLDGKKGILYLDSGNHFQEIK